MYDEIKADRAVRFIEHLRHTKGTFAGGNFALLPWQQQIVKSIYGTLNDRGVRQYQHVYIEIPKKNGKSELAAALGLYHVFADGEKNGEVYGCAAEREQASIVFDVAVDMIDQVPALKKRVKLNLSKKRLMDKPTGTYYQVLSSEAFSKHGLNVSAVIFDELHAQPNRALYDTMTFGAGDARSQPIWIVITTAGDDPDRVSIGWEVHDYASRILAGDVIDPLWYPVIYGYEGDDIYNPANWAKANPSMGHTFGADRVQDAANAAMQNKSQERLFRWLRLNQWITTKLTGWLPVDLYDATVGTWDRRDLIGRDCFVGLDLSSTTDLTATALVFPPQGDQLDWRVVWDTWIPKNGMMERIRNDKVPYDVWERNGWVTATDGDVVDYNLVEERILEYKKLYNVVEIDADRSFAAMLLQRLENAGMQVVDIPQTFATLTNPLNQVEVLLREKKISHEPNPLVRWTFGNSSVATNGNAQIKLVKEHKGKSVVRSKRIDPVAAWIDAMARAVHYNGKVDVSAAILNDDWGM